MLYDGEYPCVNGVEIPLISPAYRYTKKVLNIPVEFAKNIAEIPKAATEGSKKLFTGVTITLVILGLGVAGYLIYAGKKGTKLTP